MSVQTQIDRINANIASAYTKAQAKGAELPAEQNSENLPATIEAIPAGGLPEGLRTIAVTADPPEGGSVSGGGIAQDGMMVTVSAEPNETGNYVFDGWKENGAVVHTGPLYTFPVSGDKSLIASFAESPYVAGVDWWEAILPSSEPWNSVAYGDGKFVAISGSDKAAYSTDGVHWVETTLPSSRNWVGITYGGGKFVAVAYYSDKFAYSTDGVNWEETSVSHGYWGSVTYGNGKFIAIAGGTTTYAYSSDGVAWQTANLPQNAQWIDIAFGNEMFIVISDDGASSYAAMSLNGNDWTLKNLPLAANTSTYWRSIAYDAGNERFLAVSSGGNGGINAAATSNGYFWSAFRLPTLKNWESIAYGSGKLVVAANGSETALYSKDEDNGTNFYETAFPFAASWKKIAYGDGIFVAIAANSDKAAYSRIAGPAV